MPQQTSFATTGARYEPTFFGQVMFYFALAVMVSALGTYVSMEYFMQYFFQSPAIMYILFAVELAIILTGRLWSQKRPLNYVLFVAFAAITGITVSPLLAVVLAQAGGPAIVTKALLAAGLMFTATALIGWTTHRDLSGMRGWLMMLLIGMIVVSLLGFFFPWGSEFEMIFSGIGVVLFSAYTMYDFNMIKQGYISDPIQAALQLYLDIFNLFIFILRLLTNERN